MTLEPLTLLVKDDAHGERLDRLLTAALDGWSRTRVQALVRAGHVSGADGTIGDPGYRVKPGERLVVTLPAPEPAGVGGQAFDLVIPFEDADLLVVDKPAGMVVHPAAGHSAGTLVNALIAHCGESLSGIGGVARPGIVHRLDKDTSGLLVVAKNDLAHRGLAGQFAAHGRDGRLQRVYLAVVWGAPSPRAGTVDAPLARNTANRTRISVSRAEAAREAVTHYECLATATDQRGEPLASLLRCRLETGRTHQVRVHMAHIGHPLLGDRTYGSGFAASISRLPPSAAAAVQALGRQALHAALLGFEHPVTGEPVRIESALPADMQALVTGLGLLGGTGPRNEAGATPKQPQQRGKSLSGAIPGKRRNTPE